MKVFVTRCTVERAGRNMGHFNCDTIFLNEIPHIVFEWQESSEGEIPAITVALDPQHFHPLEGWNEVQYLYENPVKDPRPLN